ncbi:rhodanese-like domain-containing protein [Natronosalvus caseinilyticus]|uniref:rhodanese-like domain-containing protein n=1 Tax=Natronosalvus caseinilyticus TaxID=2953747 RepID=UPI0028B1B697|nr:rhodanese-like domain-containing protein [Natronosalvus caseinilyticus]
MRRRTVLEAVGIASISGLSGCLGSILEDEDSPGGDATTDEGYETESQGGQTVPLVPLEDAYEWYEADEAEFLDTRGAGQYGASHIEGAHLSTAPDGVEDDPTTEWSEDTRIVTYCGCPHSLAVLRASELLANGFENVYALDEGYNGWTDAGYPIEGESAESIPTYEIVGRSSPDHEGEYVWLSTLDESQQEISQVEADGSYELLVRFADVDEDTVLSLEAPDYALEATLGELTSGVVDA